MITVIITIIGVVCLWQLIARGFRLGERVTASSEATTQLLMLAAPQEVRDKYVAMKEAEAEKARQQRQQKFWLGVVLAIIAVFYLATQARAQTPGGLGGLGPVCCGPDGRVRAQVIVGPQGVHPVVPTFCTPGLGPCPVVVGPPLGPWAPLPPPPVPMALPPVEAVPPPPPAPLGIVWTRGTVCPEPRVCPVVWVSVAADGLNVREPSSGAPLMALANGTPLAVLERRGKWTLVAPACDLVPTGAWSVTANVPLQRCWMY